MWAGTLASPAGRLCAMRSGSAQCYGGDGIFGRGVFSLYEDSSGTLWVGAQSGLWRWKPGPPKRYATPPVEINDLKTADDGRLLISMHEVGLRAARWRESQGVSDTRRESTRINCSGTAMELSGSERWIAASSMYIMAGQILSRDRMASQAMSSSGFSRTVKATSGLPPVEDSTGFENFPSRLFPRKKVCPAMRLSPWSQPRMGAFGLVLNVV